MTKCIFRPALLESERLNVRNSTTSAILRCSVHFTIYMYLPQRNSASAAHVYAQLTRCFSAVAELLVALGVWFSPFAVILTKLTDILRTMYRLLLSVISVGRVYIALHCL